MLQLPSNSTRNLHGNSAASAGLRAAPRTGGVGGKPGPTSPGPATATLPRNPRHGGTCPGARGENRGRRGTPVAQGWSSQRLHAGPSGWSGAWSGSATDEASAPPKGRGPAALHAPVERTRLTARRGTDPEMPGAGARRPHGKARGNSGRVRNPGWTTAVVRSLRVRAGLLRGRDWGGFAKGPDSPS